MSNTSTKEASTATEFAPIGKQEHASSGSRSGLISIILQKEFSATTKKHVAPSIDIEYDVDDDGLTIAKGTIATTSLTIEAVNDSKSNAKDDVHWAALKLISDHIDYNRISKEWVATWIVGDIADFIQEQGEKTYRATRFIALQ